jgi:hypothetical protein
MKEREEKHKNEVFKIMEDRAEQLRIEKHDKIQKIVLSVMVTGLFVLYASQKKK